MTKPDQSAESRLLQESQANAKTHSVVTAAMVNPFANPTDFSQGNAKTHSVVVAALQPQNPPPTQQSK